MKGLRREYPVVGVVLCLLIAGCDSVRKRGAASPQENAHKMTSLPGMRSGYEGVQAWQGSRDLHRNNEGEGSEIDEQELLASLAVPVMPHAHHFKVRQDGNVREVRYMVTSSPVDIERFYSRLLESEGWIAVVASSSSKRLYQLWQRPGLYIAIDAIFIRPGQATVSLMLIAEGELLQNV